MGPSLIYLIAAFAWRTAYLTFEALRHRNEQKKAWDDLLVTSTASARPTYDIWSSRTSTGLSAPHRRRMN